ncbi:hypothetical protein ACX0G7_05160 [Flavitalea antarctica]
MEASGPNFFDKRWLPLIVFVTLSLLLYFPVLHNGFASDDFKSVYRAGVRGSLATPGFFRPFSDFTILTTHAIVGLDTFYYHITNVLLHGASAFLLFLLAIKLPFQMEEADRRNFAWVSAILFATYPFHNESITWIVGRGSVIATFFGLACMLCFISNLKPFYKYVVTGFLFFLGLLAYESILLLPFIMLIIFGNKPGSAEKIATWLIVFAITVFVYFLLRYNVAGVVVSEYGYGGYAFSIFTFATNFFKVAGRMFVPPSSNSTFQIIALSALVILYGSTWFSRAVNLPATIKKRRDELVILCCLLVSLIIPVTFGVSTRTSEGERLLYFPSVFIALFLAHIIVRSSWGKVVQRIVITAILLFNIYFIQVNNSNWEKASAITNSSVRQIAAIAASDKEIILINVPGEYRGAYIFRNALREAMLLNKIDTERVWVANYLNNAEYNSLPVKVLPQKVADTIYFGKSVNMGAGRLTISNFDKQNQPLKYLEIGDSTELWFWDKERFIRYQ